MNSITREYLADIVFRVINKNIDIHRTSKQYDIPAVCPQATAGEVIEFIHSIPYYDTKLKDFILGHLSETTIIISQSWENEFIIKCRAWADSFEWLHGDDRFLRDSYLDELKRNSPSLTLPY